MPTLVYVHGFLSSPQSTKAVLTQSWLQQNRPDWHFECPSLSAYAAKAKTELDTLVSGLRKKGDVFLIGSSLGGFWATYLAERFGLMAVVVNPSVKPALRMKGLVGKPISNYYTDESYTLTDKDTRTLQACEPTSVINEDLYWLMSQKGDEVLDYKDGVDRYEGCRQTVEDGGNHSFEGYEAWIPEIIDFFED